MNPTNSANFKATFIIVVMIGMLLSLCLAFVYRESVRRVRFESIEACANEFLGRNVFETELKRGCPDELGNQFKNLRSQIESRLGKATDSSYAVYRDTSLNIWCLTKRNGKPYLENYKIWVAYDDNLNNKISTCRVYDSISKLPNKSDIPKDTPLFEPIPMKR